MSVAATPASAVSRHGAGRLFPLVSALLRYSPILILCLIWEGLGLSGLVSRQMLPDLSTILSEFVRLLFHGDLLYNSFRSLSRAAAGLCAAVVIGVAIGMTMASFRPVRLLINPIVQIFYPMPRSALIPVVMIWLGLGDASKILLIFLGCLLPVVIAAYNGTKGVNPFLLWSARSLGASRFEVLREIVLQAAMPEILSGCRIALAFAFILMVSSEFLIATDGVGYMISSLGDGGIYPAMFAVIFFVSAVGFGADRLYAFAVRRLLHWREV